MTATTSLITNLDRNEEEAFHGWLRRITDQLDQTALGVTLQVLDRGVGSLSDKQLYVFERYVIDEHAVPRCSLCSQLIPWSEMHQARDTSQCAYCDNAVSKD